MTQAIYDVIPERGGWLVRMAGDSIQEWHTDKGTAIRRARELGRPYDLWRVRVYTGAGVLEQELTSAQAAS